VLDVWLVTPEDAPGYSTWISWVAVAAMVMRRWLPFPAVLVTVPGFLVGWSQLAAMIALGTLARRRGWVWQTMVGAALVWVCRYVQWPWEKFVEQNWREHVLNGIYGVIVAGMPVAIGLLIAARQELSTRISQLAASREREKRLLAGAVRAAERARLAREMHDVVSHQVSLIAMQAGALQVSTGDAAARDTAGTIRELSTRTLEELRSLVGVLRSGVVEEDESAPGLDELEELVRDSGLTVALSVGELPAAVPVAVSQAAYRTVQEALTNIRKHAQGAVASVRVVAVQDELVVEVRNDRPRRRAPKLPSGGHGLRGLRERAILLGGTFTAGKTAGGGFRVEARYPLTS
jgi:signal transduction histidine kinase